MSMIIDDVDMHTRNRGQLEGNNCCCCFIMETLQAEALLQEIQVNHYAFAERNA